jgi:F0F1-type ATP synthase assembly protein I
MLIAGGIGIGLVIGWVAARLTLRAPWNVRVWVLLSLIAQGFIVLELASRAATIGFGVALLFSALACATWVRSLEARYGPPS